VLDQGARRLREQDLATVAGGADARGAVHVEPDIVIAHQLWSAGVQAHAHLQAGALRPGVVSQSTSTLRGCCDGLGGAGEGDEEGIALGIHLGPTLRRKRRPQQCLVLSQHPRVVVAKALEELGAALDVGEQEGNGATGELCHGQPRVTAVSET
jgi:hypothetical protein